MNITFIDFIKGIVPTLLSHYLKAITQSLQLTSKIIHNFLQEVFNLSQQLIWKTRCKAMINKEKALNINLRYKKQSLHTNNNFSRSAPYNIVSWLLGTNKWTLSLDIIDKMMCFSQHFSFFR